MSCVRALECLLSKHVAETCCIYYRFSIVLRTKQTVCMTHYDGFFSDLDMNVPEICEIAVSCSVSYTLQTVKQDTNSLYHTYNLYFILVQIINI